MFRTCIPLENANGILAPACLGLLYEEVDRVDRHSIIQRHAQFESLVRFALGFCDLAGRLIAKYPEAVTTM